MNKIRDLQKKNEAFQNDDKQIQKLIGKININEKIMKEKEQVYDKKI